MTNLANKIGGALFGVAVGDALGAPLEFMAQRRSSTSMVPLKR